MQIIGIVGKKKSGKTTLANSIIANLNAKTMGKLNSMFFEYWDKLAFADPIKEFCYSVMGLTYKQCYGTDDDKNTLTKYKWEDLPHYHTICLEYNWINLETIPTGFMTARELFQEFGTGIFRKMNPNIWIEALDRKLSYDENRKFIIPHSKVVIDDCRFKNEFDYLKSKNAFLIKLERGNTTDLHQSETDLNGYGEYNLIIPAHLNEQETFQLFLDNKLF